MSAPRMSIVIPAHNEATVIGRCLDALLADAGPDDLDIVVVTNGCTDATAQVAASRPSVRVIELSSPGKAAALNTGDAAARAFPRLYLDADVVLTPGSLGRLADALAEPGPTGRPPLAVTTQRRLNLRGRPLAVRAFYAINARLPIFAESVFGRGVVGLSAEAHRRMGAFPDQIADDLFLDSLFTAAEKCEVPGTESIIETPRRVRDLVRMLARVRAGNIRLRSALPQVAPSRPTSWLRDVVLPRPWLVPAAAIYAAITLVAQRRALGWEGQRWGRDSSTR